jgi:hypothetical protein
MLILLHQNKQSTSTYLGYTPKHSQDDRKNSLLTATWDQKNVILRYGTMPYTVGLLLLEKSAKTDLLRKPISTDSIIVYTRLAVHTSRGKLSKIFARLPTRSQHAHKSFFWRGLTTTCGKNASNGYSSPKFQIL